MLSYCPKHKMYHAGPKSQRCSVCEEERRLAALLTMLDARRVRRMRRRKKHGVVCPKLIHIRLTGRDMCPKPTEKGWAQLMAEQEAAWYE